MFRQQPAAADFRRRTGTDVKLTAWDKSRLYSAFGQLLPGCRQFGTNARLTKACTSLAMDSFLTRPMAIVYLPRYAS
jgi:hypothetical protein